MRRAALWGVAAVGFVALVVTTAIALSFADRVEPVIWAWLLVNPVPILLIAVFLYHRRPEHPIPQLLLAVVVVTWCLPMPLEAATVAAMAPDPPSWTWVMALLFLTSSVVGAIGATILVGILPDGRYRSATERRVLVWTWPLALAPLLLFVTNPVVTLPAYVFPGIDQVMSPISLHALSGLGPAARVLHSSYPMVFVLGMGTMVHRYRRGPNRWRRQIRWVLLGAGITVAASLWPGVLGELGLLPPIPHGLLSTLLSIPIVLLPASIAVAVLEPPWIDVDVAIRKTFVYGALSFVILVMYVGVSAAFGMAGGTRLPVELAIFLTVVVAVLFQPARRRLQRIADRWVFGDRPSEYEVVAGFTNTVHDAADGDLAPMLAASARNAIGARWSAVAIDGHSDAVAGERDTSPALTVPIRHRSEVLGWIECGPKQSGAVRDSDRDLIETLAAQAALAIYNARLAGRIVHAQEQERRRIERNIHDGAQQELVALIARLGEMRSANRTATLTDAALGHLQEEVRRILTDLRELAQGIHPTVLADGGLFEAIQDRCGRIPLDVSIEASPGVRCHRYPDEVEGAAYFFVTEALTNVLKHASAERAWITISEVAGRLTIIVADDGVGFDRGAGRLSGLTGLEDRMAALGGSLTVSSRPGGGTMVSAEVPAEPR